MSGNSSFDRNSFQQFLASTFAVQESQIDPQLLSAILEVQRLITGGEVGIDGVMNLVVDSAREVAGAAGIAVGLLEGDQLIFRAGGGCSAGRVGSRVSAAVTLSAKAQAGREILRVENAQTDTRMEGAICRQFGAESLLILPIYRERALAGVFEVLFTEVHAFGDREVRTYRLLVTLVEAALGQPVRIKQENRGEPKQKETRAEVSAVPLALLEKGERHPSEDAAPHFSWSNVVREQCAAAWEATAQQCGIAWAGVRGMRVFRDPAMLPKLIVQRATEGISHKPLRSLTLAAVATGFGLTLWIAHGDRGVSSQGGVVASPGSTAARSVEPDKVVDGSRKDRIAPAPLKATRLAATKARRVRMGQQEVKHIGDDVTVRHFTYQPTPPRTRPAGDRVTYIGNDVTVRHFTTKPAGSSESR